MKTRQILTAGLVLTALASAPLDAHEGGHGTHSHEHESQVYRIDTVHSVIAFEIHPVSTKVSGSLGTLSGSIYFNKDYPEKSRMVTVVDMRTLDTQNEACDELLQKDAYFNTDKYPQARFKSTRFERIDDRKYKIHGNLKIKNTTRPIVFEARYFGREGSEANETTMSWEATTSINPEDFEFEDGKSLLGTEIAITLKIKAKRI